MTKSAVSCGFVYPADLFTFTEETLNGTLHFLCSEFKMAELTEVMRQRDDTRLIEMLNKIRVGDVDDAVESLLKSRLAVQK